MSVKTIKVDVLVVGGGPAGLASALEAHKHGAEVLLLERDSTLGGILNQCIHAGFGLHYFKEELTGPEYASRFYSQVERVLQEERLASAESGAKRRLRVMLNTMVLSVDGSREAVAVSPEEGLFKVQAGAIVLAMGCRERTRGAINIAGSRPAGVFSAGTAQRFVNLEGKMIGKRVVILGSGDIGLIMARRMTCEGARVECVAELMPYSSGLSRNIVQCLEDFNIPLYYNTTVTRIIGEQRVTGVELCSVDQNRKPISGTERIVECDTLLLSVGLIPENELTVGAGVIMDRVTAGAVVNQYRETSVKGIFACGNVLHVHDLVDNVTQESIIAGKASAEFALNGEQNVESVATVASGLVRYVLPQTLKLDGGDAVLYFRVGDAVKNPVLTVSSGGRVIKTAKKMVMLPGEMESVKISLADINGEVEVRVSEQ